MRRWVWTQTWDPRSQVAAIITVAEELLGAGGPATIAALLLVI